MAQSTSQIDASKAVLYIASSTTTSTPAQQVWQTLLDTSTWPSWNTFCPRVTIRHQPDTSSDETPSPILQHGTQLTLHVCMDPSSPRETDAHLVVTQCDPPQVNQPVGRIAWASDFSAAGTLPRMLLMAERVHEVEEVDGMTEVRNWELQQGYLAYVVSWMYGRRLQDAFNGWVSELKGFVEG